MYKRVLQLRENHFVLNSIVTLFLRVLGVLTLFGFTFFLTHNYEPKVVGDVKMIQLLILSTFVLGIIYFLIPRRFILQFYNNDSITYSNIQTCFFILFFYVLTLLNTEVLRALNYVYISEIFRNTLKFVSVILGSILLLYIGDPYYIVNFYLYGFVVLSILTSIMIFVDFKKKESIKSDDNISLNSIFTVSYPMAVSGLCFFLMLTFDVMLLKKYYSNEVVAYYSIAIKMFTVLAMVIIAVNINVAPKFAEYYSANKMDDLRQLLDKSKKLICLINIPAGLIIILFGKTILGVFGPNYTQAYIPMIIIVMGQMIASSFGSVAIILNMSSKQHVFKNILLVATGINLISNLLLVPSYGMTGAAISLSISLLFWNILSSYYFKFKILK